MNRWTCPYCDKQMFSSWDRRDEETTVCIHCDGAFKNPYYREQALQDYKSFVEFQAGVMSKYFGQRKEG